MKVVVNSSNDKVVGIHLVGAEVAEILQVCFCTAFVTVCECPLMSALVSVSVSVSVPLCVCKAR